MTHTSKQRIESIDILRGIVMVIMALDHSRDFFHATAWTDDPLNLATTTPQLFFTRWITHFCAPIFVFLSGTSIFLQSQRKNPEELFKFLITRGLWLIFMELTLVALGTTFNFYFHLIVLQVIWSIGISMIILAFLQKMGYRTILIIGLLIVLGHNLLDIPESAPGFKANFWWDLLHHAGNYPLSNERSIWIFYPFVPWLGLMLLGYCFGTFFTTKYLPPHRKRLFIKIGLGLILFFIILRAINIYGDPYPWAVQDTTLKTFLSFITIHKYPPSLLYMSITIGSAILALAFLESVSNKFTGMMRTFGRVAFFYYLIHWYVLHTLVLIYFLTNGHQQEMADELNNSIPMTYVVPDDGLGLPVVYAIWISVVLALYPLCRWYDHYKTSHPEKWWLSYI
jgi:uncharacterized membrane protein